MEISVDKPRKSHSLFAAPSGKLFMPRHAEVVNSTDNSAALLIVSHDNYFSSLATIIAWVIANLSITSPRLNKKLL